MTAQAGWLWSACGKHPAARDYFKIGNIFPLAAAFSDWIDRGYSAINRSGKAPHGHISWRFWAHEPKTNNVICGIIRDSRDGVGRPFPLLIAGTGPLPDWNKNWDLMPFALENSWAQIEYLSTKPFLDVRAFEKELATVRRPANSWGQFAAESRQWGEASLTEHLEDILKSQEGRAFVRLHDLKGDVFGLILQCHTILRKHSSTPPNTVFMGGRIDRVSLGIYTRPLSVSDFGSMWELEGADNEQKKGGE